MPSEPTLVTSRGPNRREKASCTSSVTSWPRKTRTECSSSAARVFLYEASAAAISASITPRSSAANPGPSGTISIGQPSVASAFCQVSVKTGRPARRRLVYWLRLRSGLLVAERSTMHLQGRIEPRDVSEMDSFDLNVPDPLPNVAQDNA